ncbi:unnamed protein product [Protopolystoma xenopodis]|uniref:Uncharacterized protein n=1 Tax=Protopolystoma xenopodis TaxID=117903 RepID=A0A448WCX2_9PLAT|nr:unnamed protein product [Protopolystoma xenopodis]
MSRSITSNRPFSWSATNQSSVHSASCSSEPIIVSGGTSAATTTVGTVSPCSASFSNMHPVPLVSSVTPANLTPVIANSSGQINLSACCLSINATNRSLRADLSHNSCSSACEHLSSSSISSYPGLVRSSLSGSSQQQQSFVYTSAPSARTCTVMQSSTGLNSNATVSGLVSCSPCPSGPSLQADQHVFVSAPTGISLPVASVSGINHRSSSLIAPPKGCKSQTGYFAQSIHPTGLSVAPIECQGGLQPRPLLDLIDSTNGNQTFIGQHLFSTWAYTARLEYACHQRLETVWEMTLRVVQIRWQSSSEVTEPEKLEADSSGQEAESEKTCGKRIAA